MHRYVHQCPVELVIKVHQLMSIQAGLSPLCQNVGCRLLDVSVHVGVSSPHVKMEQDVYAHFREQLTNDILALST